MPSLKNILRTLGPGLLWAGAAIGVSHLVQSTRAGAGFGFELVWIILLANLFKYPFFEFAPRYATATGENLIQGYERLGKWAVVLYGIITFATMFILIAAVTAVTAGLFASVFGSGFGMFWWSVIILIVAAGIVAVGRYSLIDKTVKVIIVLLALSTIIAVVFAFGKGFNPNPEKLTHFDWTLDIAFLLALIGWMPTAIDVSVWHSVWTVEKRKSSKHKPTLKESLFDFNVGYIGTVILSLGFLSLGALTMYGTGEEFSTSAVKFSEQLINLFTKSLGSWAYIIIAIASLATMVSTTITCLDAYPRVLEPTTKIIVPKLNLEKNTRKLRWVWLLVLAVGTMIIFAFGMKDLKSMVDFATTVSFLVAPILGYLNLKVVTLKHVPKEAQPSKKLIILAWIGLAVLTVFSIYFILLKLHLL